jgi:hypothetical protein
MFQREHLTPSSAIAAQTRNSLPSLCIRTDVVEDIHPRVLLYGEDQPLSFLYVERTRVFDLDFWHLPSIL